ncbi:AGAP006274-PA-like protein [Anopheles sinensis]|uniref:AGAP006274-PA-like protein n=1 Tax=Anopheles sinensis TaxID=74873 RepID=A0A084WKE9_ANOSI|nr:AGAP006274-PA-like protein [Anopheles sinensis]
MNGRSPQPPQYVYWQRNDRMINYDDSRRDITIETTPGPRTQSRLIIREPQINDSGNYTCSASNTEPASIYVFVSKEGLNYARKFATSSKHNTVNILSQTPDGAPMEGGQSCASPSRCLQLGSNFCNSRHEPRARLMYCWRRQRHRVRQPASE